MSDIDQAFINAYADPSVATTVPQRGKFAVRQPGPALRVFSQAGDREFSEHRIDQPQRGAAAAHSKAVADTLPPAYAEIAAWQRAESNSADELALPSLIGERKPLSAFAAQKPTPATAFKPVFEVDSFRWPAITDDLITSSTECFSPVVDIVMSAVAEGRTLIGIGGSNGRVGTSTVAMCLARLVAASGSNVVLLDANFLKGDLARTLGLEFNQGWDDVLAGNLPLAECAVTSLTDKMTLIPLGGPSEHSIERLSSIQSSVIAGMLRYHHDLVLFDLGAASEPTQLAAAHGIVENCRLDAGIIVATVGARDPITAHGMDQLNAVFGPLCLGVVGNRAS